MNVYLDAVFKPRCVTPDAQWVLQQEGWHVTVASEGDYDYDAPGDAAQDQDGEGEGDPGERRSLLEREELVFKGVVLAEMKGAYSDPEDRLEQLAQGLLFPDTTYQYVSGGAPDAIITLKHDEFVDFYERHYHASNAQLLVSGTSGDIYEALDQAAAYLDSFTARKDLREATRIPYQAKRFTSTVATSVPYAADDEGDGYMATWSWLLNDKPWDPVTEMAWVVLNMLLLGTDTATLQFALTQSKLGSDVIGGGFSNYLLQSTFGVGLRGIKEQSDVNKVGGLIFATLATIVKDGFHPEEIESAINTVEFLVRHPSLLLLLSYI
jgi:Zn-dependent M16 (insulinase) family peptidase